MKPIIKPKANGKTVIPLAIDSGAFSFFMKHGASRTAEGKLIRGFANVDDSYSETPAFFAYLDAYMEFIRAHGKEFEYCVALDVIGNPKKSFDIYKEMSKQGLKVLPVYHFGEDPVYLKRYMDSTDYIGLGGLVKTGNKASSQGFQERTWKKICDNKGRPQVKVHAFGMTSFEPMLRHPYYSVDSTTSFTWSRFGCIMVPNIIGSRFDFSNVPQIFPLTPRRTKAKAHLDFYHPTGHYVQGIEDYVSRMGLTLDDLRTNYGTRDTANLSFMNNMMTALAAKHSKKLDMKVDMIYYASGNFSTTLEEFNKSLAHLGARKEAKHLAYLGTYFEPNPLARVMRDWRNVDIKHQQHRGHKA